MRPTVLTLILVAALAQTLAATTVFVPSQQSTIQAGINAANTHDTVLVSSGTYIENINFSGKRIKVIGQFGARATVLKAQIPSDVIVRFVTSEDSSTQLSGFTIEGGTATSAILVSGASPRISNNIVEGYRGGANSVAIRCDNGNPLIWRNVFYDNTGISCIGIWTGTARIINNTFDHNARGFFTISGAGEARNNIVTNSTEYGVSGAFPAFQYNDVWNNNPNYANGAAAGLGCITTNPLYLDVPNRDYRLSPTSPCVNAGDPNPIYNDLDGTRNDMGASPGDGEGYPLPLSIIVGPSCGSIRVTSLTPLISWQYADIGSTTQQGYEVQVGTDQDWSYAEMWASGPVADWQMNVAYQGYPLSDRTRYYFRMRVYNGTRWGSWIEHSFLTWLSPALEVPAGFSTIQAAINAACSGDTIIVSPGTYAENVLVSAKSVLIRSTGAPSDAILMPAAANLPCLQFADCPDTTAELRGFTVLAGNATVGISLTGTGRPIIRNCVFRGYTGSDVVIKCQVTNALITRNVFYSNLGISCVGIYSGSARIINNTFDSNNRGIFSISNQGEARNNIITNSVEYGISGSFSLLQYNDVWFNTPNYQSPATPGVGSISLDPWFADQLNHDYHLLSRSPCINGGDPAPQYVDEDGSRNDIGAYVGNRAPTLASIGSKSTHENELLDFVVSAVDPDGNSPALTTSTLPANAAFIDHGNGVGSFTFAPTFQQAGTYNVTFRASDGIASDSERVLITVINVNQPPILASIGAKSGSEGQLLTFKVAASDSDGTVPSLTVSALPIGATFVDSGNGGGAFSFTPGFKQSGTYQLTFFASDGSAIDSEQVTLTIQNVPRPASIAAVTIDGAQSPSHLVNHVPLLQWEYTDPELVGQTIYEIAVGTDNDWQVAETWSPVPIASTDTFATYDGDPLIDGQTYYLRLRIYTDQVWSAWFETSFHMNAAPAVPLQRMPVGWAIANRTPTLWILNSTDIEDDPIVYEFSGFNDTDCVAGVPISLVGVPGETDSTGGHVLTPLAENCLYWWRVRAFDGREYSDWSSYANFWVDGTPEPPTTPQLQAPPPWDGTPLFTIAPALQWTPSFDRDPLDTVRYTLELSLYSNFSFVLTVDSLLVSQWIATDSLQFGTHYWWRVTAQDKTGLSAMSTVRDFWTWKLGDINRSHTVDLTDLSIMIAFLLGTGGTIEPKMVGDITGDCRIDLVDLSTMVSYLLGSGGQFKAGCQ